MGASMIFDAKSKVHELLGSSWQAYFLTLVAVIALIPVITWVNSLWSSQHVKPGTGREPPVLPYCIPYIQHLYAFLDDPMSLYDSVK